MKNLFLTNSIKWITKYNSNYTEEDIEKLKYGLEGLYLTITKLVIITIIAILFGILKETVVLLILFNIIRYPAFGFHADNSITCLFFSIAVFLGLPYIMLHLEINIYIKIILSLICLIGFILYAPADTPKRPLTNKRKRRLRKISSIVVAIIYIACSFIILNKTISTLFLAALLIEFIMINPITYKIFNQSYNNYKLH